MLPRISGLPSSYAMNKRVLHLIATSAAASLRSGEEAPQTPMPSTEEEQSQQDRQREKQSPQRNGKEDNNAEGLKVKG